MEARQPGIAPAGSPYKVLVVDDEAAVADLLAEGLSMAGFRAQSCHSGPEAISRITTTSFDAVVTDLRMPGSDGRDVLAHAKRNPGGPEVVVLTSAAEVDVAVECMRMGAFDYIQKPFDLELVVSTVLRAAERHRFEAESRELREVIKRSKYALMVALEARDSYTLQHCVNVARLARGFGEYVGAPQPILDAIDSVGELHDVGKIGIGDAILNKKGPLTEVEREAMGFHPQIGLEIIDPLGTFPDEGCLVSAHHERWDGTGYPVGLIGDEIPLIARITSIVDVFDACTTDRPYRRAMSIPDGLAIIKNGAGTGFSPELAPAFLKYFTGEFGEQGDRYVQAAVGAALSSRLA